MCTDNADSMANLFAVEYNRLLSPVIDRCSSLLSLLLAHSALGPTQSSWTSSPRANQRTSFVLLYKYVEMIGFPLQVTPGLLDTLIHRTVALDLLLWIAKTRHDTLEVTLPGTKILN